MTKKSKKIILGLVTASFFLKGLFSKIYASTLPLATAALYGVQPSSTKVGFSIFSLVIMPITLLIGIIVYFIKSKKSIWRKFLFVLIMVGVYFVIYILLSSIMNKFF